MIMRNPILANSAGDAILEKLAPASFEEGRNRRRQARAAGLNPNHWYAVEHSRALPPGAVREVTFWNRSIAVFRAADGALGAIENRCIHRHIKLTLGSVCGDHLVCPYHGWEYASGGEVAKIPHDLFGRSMPKLRVPSYPIKERYGLLWIFPGDSSRAELTPLPRIPELEGPRPWALVAIDFVWRAHFSMIIENLLDFTHAYLHRRFHPFDNASLTHFESEDGKIVAEYKASIGAGKISGMFVNRSRVDTSRISSCFEYPYQRANTDDKIKHWCFLLPIDVRTTRVFFNILFDFDALRIPLTSLRMPGLLVRLFLAAANGFMITPLLQQDGRAVEAEQQAHESVRDLSADGPFVEFNPISGLVQELILRRWKACQAPH